jgi:hypothetical protein
MTEVQRNLNDNELIAIFMGGHQNPEGHWYNVKPIQDGKNGYLLSSSFKYDTSWDWLMPVVEKIARMEIGEGDDDRYYTRTFGMMDKDNFMVRINRHPLFHHGTLIGAMYQAVIYFIKCHNSINQ